MPGLLSGLALFVEERRRRAELAMYVLPKALESAWIVARGKVGMKPWRGGEGIVSLCSSFTNIKKQKAYCYRHVAGDGYLPKRPASEWLDKNHFYVSN